MTTPKRSECLSARRVPSRARLPGDAFVQQEAADSSSSSGSTELSGVVWLPFSLLGVAVRDPCLPLSLGPRFWLPCLLRDVPWGNSGIGRKEINVMALQIRMQTSTSCKPTVCWGAVF